MKKTKLIITASMTALINLCQAMEMEEGLSPTVNPTFIKNKTLCLGIKKFYGLEINKNYKEALNIFKNEAKNNNLIACYYLTRIYNEGLGLESSYKEYKYNYQKLISCKNKNLFKTPNVINFLNHNANIKNNADVQSDLGSIYRYVDKNFKEAAKYYRLAADQGHARGQYNLGLCYKNGSGVDKNSAEALKYYMLAADQEYAAAQYNLAICYENGEGVDKNLKKTIEYLHLAADQEYAAAQYNLAICYENGEGVDKNLKKALKYYMLAADQEYAAAQYNLAIFYALGKGGQKNLKKTIEYLHLAADQEYAAAQYKVGRCYENGHGVDKNLKKALKYYMLAADQGHAKARQSAEAHYAASDK